MLIYFMGGEGGVPRSPLGPLPGTGNALSLSIPALQLQYKYSYVWYSATLVPGYCTATALPLYSTVARTAAVTEMGLNINQTLRWVLGLR